MTCDVHVLCLWVSWKHKCPAWTRVCFNTFTPLTLHTACFNNSHIIPTAIISIGYMANFNCPSQMARILDAKYVTLCSPRASPALRFLNHDMKKIKSQFFSQLHIDRLLGLPDHFPYEGLVHPITLNLCVAKFYLHSRNLKCHKSQYSE